jgi:hypothetical protein
MPQLVEVIGKFIEEHEIDNLEKLQNDKKLKTEIVSKLVREFRRENISRMQFVEFIERLDHYKEFRNLMLDIKDNRKSEEVKQKAKELLLEQKKKMTVVKEEEVSEASEEDTEKDREREERALEAEIEDTYTIDQDSLDVVQEIFETMNAQKILVGAASEKKKAQQQLYLNFYGNNQNARID